MLSSSRPSAASLFIRPSPPWAGIRFKNKVVHSIQQMQLYRPIKTKDMSWKALGPHARPKTKKRADPLLAEPSTYASSDHSRDPSLRKDAKDASHEDMSSKALGPHARPKTKERAHPLFAEPSTYASSDHSRDPRLRKDAKDASHEPSRKGSVNTVQKKHLG